MTPKETTCEGKMAKTPINWKTQEVIINPKLLDMIPKLNSWLPPDYINEILRDVQVYSALEEVNFDLVFQANASRFHLNLCY